MRITLETLPMYCEEYGDCLHWAQGVNGQGYPQANIDGKPWMVRRYVYSVLLGNTLAPRQPIASRCGHKACVTPSCIFATSHSAVLRRSYKNGGRSTQHEYLARLSRAKKQGLAKLTQDQVTDIRSMPETVTHAAIAAQYGMSYSAVAQIRQGKSWRETAPASSVFAWRP